MVLPLASLMWSVVRGEAINIVEFLRTYALWAFSSLTILFSYKLPILARHVNSESLEKAAFACLVVLCAFSLTQTVAFAGLGSTVLYNPFGQHQYLGEYDVSRFANARIIRAPGFYLEPSFNAFVITSLYAICLLGNFRLWISSILTLSALFFIQSVTGLIVFIVIWLLVLMNIQFGKSKARKTWGRLGIVNLVLALAIMFSGGVGGIVKAPGADAATRLTEINAPGSSGYYRMVAPLTVIRDVLTYNPLGKPLGHIEETLVKYQLKNGQQQGTSLDNGLYLLVFYFGWLGVVFIAFLIVNILKQIGSPTGSNKVLALGFVLASLNFSGGILLPEYIFLLILVLYQFRLQQLSSTSEYNYAPSY